MFNSRCHLFIFVTNETHVQQVLQLKINLSIISEFPLSHSLHDAKIGKIQSVIFHKSSDR